MPATAAFWDRTAERYAASPIADEAAYQAKVAATQRLLRPDMELFEFGCGTGSTALLHAPHVRHIRAVDFSARMVEIARTKAESAGIDNVTFEQGDIETVDLAPQSLDMALALSVLHLLPNKEAAIAKVFSALKPGGYFVSSTACVREMVPVLAFLTPLTNRLNLPFMPYLDAMTQDQLAQAITQAGFAIEHQWTPNKKAATFIIARKPDAAGASQL
jgi:ubiquinone/menaquinone biosynthesis C-methylase UbiE